MYKDFKAVDLGPQESALSHLGIQAGALPKLAMNDSDEKPPEHIRIVQLDECVLENPAAGLSRSLTSQDGGGSAREWIEERIMLQKSAEQTGMEVHWGKAEQTKYLDMCGP